MYRRHNDTLLQQLVTKRVSGMSANQYFNAIQKVLDTIATDQLSVIQRAGAVMANVIHSGGVCYLFGSGHSHIPALDCFPRYGSFVGLKPLIDPHLVWTNVVGADSAPELLWLERTEGYIAHYLQWVDIRSCDVMVVYSHGGLNAAPVEAALYAKDKGCFVIAVTSLQNASNQKATHSSGKRLCDIADIVIDNCVPPEDSLVRVGPSEIPVAAGSTVSTVMITMALVAEIAEGLVRMGDKLSVFLSPNVHPDMNFNMQVFRDHVARVEKRS